MKCAQCGFENLEESTFCTACRTSFIDQKSLRRLKKRLPYTRPSFNKSQAALMMAMMVPGAGHIYIGEFFKGFIIFISVIFTLAGAIYFIGTGWHASFFTVFSFLMVYSMGDAYTGAQREAGGKEQINLRPVYTRIIVGYLIAVCLALVFFESSFSTYTIDRDIQALGLRQGDQILFKRNYYITHPPHINDLVVYEPRVIGRITRISQKGFLIMDEVNRQRQILIDENLRKNVSKGIYVYAPLNRRRIIKPSKES